MFIPKDKEKEKEKIDVKSDEKTESKEVKEEPKQVKEESKEVKPESKEVKKDKIEITGEDHLEVVEEEKKSSDLKEFIGFEINSKVFSELLRIVMCKGIDTSGKDSTLMENCVFVVGSNKIISNNVDPNQVIFLSMLIKTKTFKTDNFEENIIPISIKSAIESLERFKNTDIKVIYDGSQLLFVRAKPKLVYKMENINVTSISNYVTGEFPMTMIDGIPVHRSNKSALHCRIVTNGKELNELLKDGKLIGIRYFPFEANVSENSLNVAVSNLIGTKSIEREIPVDSINVLKSDVKLFKSTYSHGFGNVVPNINGKITLYFDNNEYIYISKETGIYKLDILIANSELTTDERLEESDVKEFKFEDIQQT